MLKNWSAPRDPIKARSSKASVQSGGLICSSVLVLTFLGLMLSLVVLVALLLLLLYLKNEKRDMMDEQSYKLIVLI